MRLSWEMTLPDPDPVALPSEQRPETKHRPAMVLVLHSVQRTQSKVTKNKESNYVLSVACQIFSRLKYLNNFKDAMHKY